MFQAIWALLQMRSMAMTQIFETKKIHMETLPEYLKAARESFSYDLKHVAKITNISPKFIENLEQGYYHRLPADVYVHGFLRKLAELYRTQADVLIEQYKKERGVHDQITKKAEVAYKSYTDSKFEVTPKTLTFAGLGLFVLFIFGYLFYQVHALNQPPRITITQPQDGARITSSSVIVQGHVDIGATLSMNDQQIFVDSEGNFKQPISISPGEKVLLFSAKNNFGKESTKQLVVIGDFGTKETPVVNAVNLTISGGPNPTWITVQIDDGAVQNDNLSSGVTKTYFAKNKIMLSTGNAGSTSVNLNGKNLGKVGKEGEVVRDIPFTAESK